MATFLGFEFGEKKKVESKETFFVPSVGDIKIHQDNGYDTGFFNYGSLAMSNDVQYFSTGTYVKWGAQNDRPKFLYGLYNSSPTHHDIINSKTKYVIGDGITYDETKIDASKKSLLDMFIKNAYDEKPLQEIAYEAELDWQISGAFYLMITWAPTFDKIVNVKRIKFSKMRNGERNEYDKVTKFYYCRDWSKSSKFGIKEYPAFSVADKEHTTQILYVESLIMEDDGNYPTPSYNAGIQWIQTDGEIGVFTQSNIRNSFNPSLAIKLFSKPETPEKKQSIIRGFYEMFQGARKAGIPAIMFSNDKANAPEIQTIAANDLPKTFIPVAKMVRDQIISAHGGVSGILWGVAEGGALSQTNEYENAYKIFAKKELTQDRTVLENTLNRILKINGFDVNLQFKEFNIFKDQIVEATPPAPVQAPSQPTLNKQ